MSNKINPFSNPSNGEIVKKIDQLNLPIIQKHHIRLLAHCLEIFKELSKDQGCLFEENELLREWCYKQSYQFDDEEFTKLFYSQMSSAAKKLNSFSKSIKKNFKELDLEDLILLVEQERAN